MNRLKILNLLEGNKGLRVDSIGIWSFGDFEMEYINCKKIMFEPLR